jgi:hypothetical protein
MPRTPLTGWNGVEVEELFQLLEEIQTLNQSPNGISTVAKFADNSLIVTIGNFGGDSDLEFVIERDEESDAGFGGSAACRLTKIPDPASSNYAALFGWAYKLVSSYPDLREVLFEAVNTAPVEESD